MRRQGEKKRESHQGSSQGESISPEAPGRDQGSECIEMRGFHGASADGQRGDVIARVDCDT